MSTVEEELSTVSDEESIQKERVYYPNNIGFPAPCSSNEYEFVMTGLQNDKHEALRKILDVLQEQRSPLISLSFFKDQPPNRFVMDVIVDISQAKCSPDALLVALNKIKKFVKVAEMAKASESMFSRFLFPLTFFGNVRALAMDSDRLVRLSKHMTDELGDKARRVIFDDGHEEGVEIIESLRGFFADQAEKEGRHVTSSEFNALILDNAKSFLLASGWGSLFFSKVEGSDLYRVSISDPPTDADGGIVFEDFFLQGMVAAIVEPFLEKEGIKLSLTKEDYDDKSRILTLYYTDQSLREISPAEEKCEVTGKEAKTEEKETIEPILVQQSALSPPNGPIQTNEAAEHVERVIESINKMKNQKPKRRLRAKKLAKEKTELPENVSQSPEDDAKQKENVVVVNEGTFGSGVTIIGNDEDKSQEEQKAKHDKRDDHPEESVDSSHCSHLL